MTSPIGQFDHVAIAVRPESRAGIRQFMIDTLGATPVFNMDSPEFSFEHFQLGQAKIEVLWPTTEESFLTRFLEKRGEGLHHITLTVDDLDGTCARLADDDISVVDINKSNPEWMEAFISPRSAFGVLFQLAQSGKKSKVSGT